jgi:hypothetical protein
VHPPACQHETAIESAFARPRLNSVCGKNARRERRPSYSLPKLNVVIPSVDVNMPDRLSQAGNRKMVSRWQVF